MLPFVPSSSEMPTMFLVSLQCELNAIKWGPMLRISGITIGVISTLSGWREGVTRNPFGTQDSAAVLLQ